MTSTLASSSLFRRATTTAGEVLGIVNDGVIQFKGIPYGAPTGGTRRFRAPEAALPWSGVRECIGYGPICPQVPTSLANQYGQLIQFDVVPAEGGMSEDCLNLNIWTCGLRDGRKRPVIVSIHGGAFAIASGNARIYDGAQLAKTGDVVIVSLSHRLASFGYLNLLDLGSKLDQPFSANPGLADIVLALQWVRDNIENFGGDPGRLLLWGQSGGGWKVSALMGMPAAKGLFTRAAVQSGSLLRLQERNAAAAVAETLIAELGLTLQTLRTIQDLPWTRLLEAQLKIGAQAFMPYLDGTDLTHHPFDPGAPDESAQVPLIVSTTRDDAGLFFNHFGLDEAGLQALLAQQFGARATEILELYRDKAPAQKPYLLHARIITDAGFRRFAYMQAERKSRQGDAPVYMYQWNWPSPSYEGVFGAVHAIDVPAVFGNVRDAILGGGCAPGRALSAALSHAWMAFAADGVPNLGGDITWRPYTIERRSCLMLDDPISLAADPDREIREYWARQSPPLSVLG